MSDDKLTPDPESLQKWEQLTQGAPSKEALPPAMGGLGLSRRMIWFAALIGVAILLGLIARGLS